MSFPTTPILDLFTRADETPVGAPNWSGPTYLANGQLNLTSNQLVGGTALVPNFSYWSATSFTTDATHVVECFYDVVTVNGTDRFFIEFIVNPSTGVENGYEVQFNRATNVVRLNRIDAAVSTTLQNGSATIANGDGLGWSNLDGHHAIWYRSGGVGSWNALFTFFEDTYKTGFIGPGVIGNVNVLDNFGGGVLTIPTPTLGGRGRSVMYRPRLVPY